MLRRFETRKGRRFAWLGLLAALACTGCGGVGELRGKVTYQNKALTSGTVMAQGKDGIARHGQIEKDGTYRIPGLPVGDAKITVYSPNPNPTPEGAEGAAVPPDQVGARFQPKTMKPSATPTDWVPIPDHYADPEKSGLTAKVEKGVTTHNIDLK